MSEPTRPMISEKDANDLCFLTRNDAVEVVVRLMEERDDLVDALQACVDRLAPAYRGTTVEADARAAIAKATGEGA